jgi:hypothetical protein
MIAPRQWVSDGKYYVEGEILPFGRPSIDKMWYPKEVVVNSYNYLKSKFSNNGLLGELDADIHRRTLNLDYASHCIVDLRLCDDCVYVKARVMDTPYGKIAKTLMDEGINLLLCDRARGSRVKIHPFEENMCIVAKYEVCSFVDLRGKWS